MRRTIVHRDGKSFSCAGIWENWRDPSTSKWERTFAIVTAMANGLITNINDRMPIILMKPTFTGGSVRKTTLVIF